MNPLFTCLTTTSALFRIILLVHIAGGVAFSSWKSIAPSGPSPGYVTGHAGVADYGSDAALFFGGHNGHNPATNDLWRFSSHGKSWEKLHTDSVPPAPRQDHCGATCASSSQSQALFFGGSSSDGRLLNDVWSISLGANISWRELRSSSGNQPSPRKNCACVCLGASFFVVFGGKDASGVNGDLWVMTIDTRAWSFLQSTSPAPGPLFAPCMHALSSSSVFMFGGMNSNSVASSDVWVLSVNVSTQSTYPPSIGWQHAQAQPGPAARAFHGCVGIPNFSEQETSSVVHIHSGVGSGETRNDNLLQDFWSCSVVSKDASVALQCRAVAFDSPLPLCSQCISVIMANIVLVHGGLGIAAQVRGQTSLLHLSDSQVETVLHPGEEAPSSRHGAVSVFFTRVDGTKCVFVHGGTNTNGELLADTWILDLATSLWFQLSVASGAPPARSHACGSSFNNFIVVFGGKCSSDSPWMFNTVSYQWSPLLSAKSQQVKDMPSSRWGQGCALLPQPGKDSPHALALYVFGGTSVESGSVLNDMWSLDLDLVQSLRQDTTSSPTSPQILSIDSRSKQFVVFKLSPTHIHPLSPGYSDAVPRNLNEQVDLGKSLGFVQPNKFKFKQDSASSGFSYVFSIVSWIRIVPPIEDSGSTFMIFELLEPLQFSFDPAVQNPLLRLYLRGMNLELVDFNWKTSCPASTQIFRVAQSPSNISLMDGLWHHVTTVISTELHKAPTVMDDPDLLYLFASETCTGPNVSTLVGTDFCDRDDVQKMLNKTGSDSIRCIYNPGATKRIRLSRSCHSSLPTGVANNVEQGYFRASEIGAHGLLYDPPPDGDDARYGSYWTIPHDQTLRVPVMTSQGNVAGPQRLNAILYCRTLEQSSHKCIDNPLRSATRTAKIFIDGVQVAFASHVDNTSRTDPVCSLKTNLRIAYPHIASYLNVGVSPDFDDDFDAFSVGPISKNRLSLQLGIVSVFLSDVSDILPSLVSNSLSTNRLIANNGLLYFWDFSNSSQSMSNAKSCFLEYSRQNGTERDAVSYEKFSVCAFMGLGLPTTSPYLVTDSTLQNFSTSRGLKSRGWKRESYGVSNEKPPPANNHMVPCVDGALIYVQCSVASVCKTFLWSFESSTNTWKPVPVVQSAAMLPFSFADSPYFSGPTVQYQDNRLYVIGGNIRTDSEFNRRGRFTVATFDVNAERRQAIMNLFVYDEFSAVVDAASASNGTHAFVFGGKIGWGRSERIILILSYTLMQVTKLLVAPTSPPSALFSAVVSIEYRVPKSWLVEGAPTKKGLIIMYGGSVLRPVEDSSKQTFSVSSEYFNFDTDLSLWKRYWPQYVTNNISVNVNSEGWTSSPSQRYFPLPPLTEHSIITTQTVEMGLSITLIIGGFSRYLDDGITPDHTSYNRNIYYSGNNGAGWMVRGQKSRAFWNTDTSFVENMWITPRSAAAVFAYKRMETSEKLIFVHGGRYFNGSHWANGGALDDIWVFSLEKCIFVKVPPEEVGFYSPCQMFKISTNPPIPRYFHTIATAPVAGELHFVLIGGFAANGISALQNSSHRSNNTFGVLYCKDIDVLLASYFMSPLSFIWLPILFNAPLYSISALSSVRFNYQLGVFFLFGGSNVDFTRHESSAASFFKNIWSLSFDPTEGKCILKELNVLGNQPIERAAAYMFTVGYKLFALGGITKDFRVQPDVFELSLSNAHPNLTKVFGGVLSGGIVGSICNVYVSAQTIMSHPALSCESCFTATVKGDAPGSPSYNLVFEAAGSDADRQAAIYKSSFIPLVSGMYKLSVSTLFSTVEGGLPFAQGLEVLPGPTCASTSRFINIESAISGSNMRFLVQCNDAFSNSRPGGDTIHAMVTRMNSQDAASSSLERSADGISLVYTDLKSGSHEVVLSITRSATYSITSKFGLRIIENRPFSFVVTPKAAFCKAAPGTCNTVVVGDMDTFLAGSARSMLVASFDDYYNLADPQFEDYKVSYTSATDGTIFQDVAVSYTIIKNIAVYSIYFFSSSDGLLLAISHNGTRIPPSNFIRRSMQVDDFLSVLENNGFKSLLEEQTVARPPAAQATTTIRSFEPTQSNNSLSTISNEIHLSVQNVFIEPDAIQTSVAMICTVVFSLVAGLIIGAVLNVRSSRVHSKIGVEHEVLSKPSEESARPSEHSGQVVALSLFDPKSNLIRHQGDESMKEDGRETNKKIIDMMRSLSPEHRSRIIEEILCQEKGQQKK